MHPPPSFLSFPPQLVATLKERAEAMAESNTALAEQQQLVEELRKVRPQAHKQDGVDGACLSHDTLEPTGPKH